jgi:serine protease AprX
MFIVAILVATSTFSPLSTTPLPTDLQVIEVAGARELRTAAGELFHRTTAVVDGLQRVEFPGGDGFVALWSEGRGPDATDHYVIHRAARGFARVRETDYRIHMKRGVFDPRVETPAIEPQALAGSLSLAGDLHLVQFICPPLEEFREELATLGATVHQFLPMHTRIVRMDAETAGRVEALPFVRWVGPYNAHYRLEQELLDGLTVGNLAPLVHCFVQVFEKGPGQKAQVAPRIESLGGQIVAQIPDGYRLEALLTPAQILTVAALDEVLFIDRVTAPEPDLNIVRSVGGANALETLEGFTGQGVRGEVVDGNVRETHDGFQHDPLLLHNSKSGSTDHGTKTTGVIFGDGTGQSSARGILPDAQGIFADYSFLSNRYSHTSQLLQAPYFAVFQSNSWGSSQTTAYNSTSSQMDDILFDMDITITQSQSNTGNQNSRPQAWAKNIVAVGGIRHNNNATLTGDNWGGGASIGPAADGRVKPDVCFFYDSIWTTDDESDSDYTTGFCCTSAATPCVGGYVGLIQQMWSGGLFGNSPVGATVFERRAKASTVRALLVNSATQYTFSGTNHDLTRTHQGWGLPDVETLHDNKDEMLIVNEDDLIAEGTSISYDVTVPPGTGELKATLVYLDPPGTTSASQHRINDLSLRVTSPGGTVYWGNNGLLAGNWSTANGSSNTIDVIENVFVQSAAAGNWTIEVLADEINQDGHVETGATDADFALVVSGVEDAPPCPQPNTFCTAKTTSLGQTPIISWQGEPVIAAAGFEVTVSLAVPGKIALVFWGDAPASTPFLGGTLCVTMPLQRGDTITTDILGSGSWPLDLSKKQAGTSESYQVWFRDPADPTGFGIGLSDGLTVTYCE